MCQKDNASMTTLGDLNYMRDAVRNNDIGAIRVFVAERGLPTYSIPFILDDLPEQISLNTLHYLADISEVYSDDGRIGFWASVWVESAASNVNNEDHFWEAVKQLGDEIKVSHVLKLINNNRQFDRSVHYLKKMLPPDCQQ